MFASIVTPLSPLLNVTVTIETPDGLTISALSSCFSGDAAAPFIPEQALSIVPRQATAINFFTLTFPSSSRGFPRMPLDSFVLDHTGGVNQRQMREALREVADLSA